MVRSHYQRILKQFHGCTCLSTNASFLCGYPPSHLIPCSRHQFQYDLPCNDRSERRMEKCERVPSVQEEAESLNFFRDPSRYDPDFSMASFNRCISFYFPSSPLQRTLPVWSETTGGTQRSKCASLCSLSLGVPLLHLEKHPATKSIPRLLFYSIRASDGRVVI